MMDLDSISGNLGGANLNEKMTPVSFIRKQTLSMDIFMNNSVNLQSLLVSSVQDSKTDIFYLLVYNFPRGKQNS